MLGGILRRKGIDEELEIRIAFLTFLVQIGVHTEELGITDANAMVHQITYSQPSSYASHAQHLFALLVPYLQVINDQTSVPGNLYSPDFDFSIENAFKYSFNAIG